MDLHFKKDIKKISINNSSKKHKFQESILSFICQSLSRADNPQPKTAFPFFPQGIYTNMFYKEKLKGKDRKKGKKKGGG